MYTPTPTRIYTAQYSIFQGALSKLQMCNNVAAAAAAAPPSTSKGPGAHKHTLIDSPLVFRRRPSLNLF